MGAEDDVDIDELLTCFSIQDVRCFPKLRLTERALIRSRADIEKGRNIDGLDDGAGTVGALKMTEMFAVVFGDCVVEMLDMRVGATKVTDFEEEVGVDALDELGELSSSELTLPIRSSTSESSC